MRALALAFVACCRGAGHDPDPTPPQVTNQASTDAPSIDTKEPTVSSATFTFRSRRRDKPPLSTLFVDLSLRNTGPSPRWFLIPASTGKGQIPMATSAFGATVWSFPGTGNVVVAEFESAGSFYAIQLPPDAEVELRELKIRLAGEPEADPLPLEVITADSFTVGGQPPSAWTQIAATCEPRADATQKDAKPLRDYTPADLKTVAVEIQGAERLAAPLAIAK